MLRDDEMDSVLRMRTIPRYSSLPCDPREDDDEDVAVDFSNAVLYIGALQTVAATVLTSVVSIVACAAMPGNWVSAVRTLVLSSIVGISVVRKPFRLGRVHGLNLIFRALQPCVAIYIFSEIAEQLVHTCTRDSSAPSWRRLVFHSCRALMLISGFLRAKRPLAQTDFPFLLTLLALFVVAMLPPSAVILAGPLCSSPTLATAAERITRAFVFALLYSIFVYAAAPPVQSSAEVMICTMRASAASIWVLAVNIWLLPLAVVQCAIVIYIRIFGDEYKLDDYDDMSPAVASSPTIEHAVGLDMEEANVSAPSQNEPVGGSIGAVGAVASDLIVPTFQPLGARGLIDIGGSSTIAVSGGGGGSHTGFGDVNVAAIAARLEAETNNHAWPEKT